MLRFIILKGSTNDEAFTVSWGSIFGSVGQKGPQNATTPDPTVDTKTTVLTILFTRKRYRLVCRKRCRYGWGVDCCIADSLVLLRSISIAKESIAVARRIRNFTESPFHPTIIAPDRRSYMASAD